jgi:hypothetical protein
MTLHAGVGTTNDEARHSMSASPLGKGPCSPECSSHVSTILACVTSAERHPALSTIIQRDRGRKIDGLHHAVMLL